MARRPDIQTVAFVSLGCPKNLVDSEKMLGLLAEEGLVPVSDHARADAIVVNTCGFLEASKEESVREISRAAAMKKTGACKRLVVAGCLVQRHRARILDWCPDIDALIGVFDRDRIVTAVRGPLKSDPPPPSEAGRASSHPLPLYSSIAASAVTARRQRGLDSSLRGYFESDTARLRLTPRHYAYLRVSEGCNQNCTFCTIPSIRGKMRSKPPEEVINELRELMTDGAFEVNLIGQDTTSYGQDIGYEPGLAGLLELLSREAAHSGGGWLRLMYAYPSCFTEDMIDAIAKLPGVVKYIDMPLQHISDPVLERMRRKTSRKLIDTLLNKLRDRVPGVAIRTTFISGFPGETEAQHRELVDFVKGFGFEAMGVFAYSPEPGTPAGTLHADGQAVPEEVVKRRIDELMTAQQEVVFAHNARLASENAQFDVLIDSAKSKINNQKSKIVYVGRTSQQAPQIDGQTIVHTRQRLSPGELVCCRITGTDGYDLIAQPTAETDRALKLPVMAGP